MLAVLDWDRGDGLSSLFPRVGSCGVRLVPSGVTLGLCSVRRRSLVVLMLVLRVSFDDVSAPGRCCCCCRCCVIGRRVVMLGRGGASNCGRCCGCFRCLLSGGEHESPARDAAADEEGNRGQGQGTRGP